MIYRANYLIAKSVDARALKRMYKLPTCDAAATLLSRHNKAAYPLSGMQSKGGAALRGLLTKGALASRSPISVM